MGLNVDTRLDTEFRRTPPVAPVVGFFSERAATEVREKKVALAQAITSGAFVDQIMYFGCHGSVTGGEAETAAQAQVTLSDDDPIRTTDFIGRLNTRPLPSNPALRR